MAKARADHVGERVRNPGRSAPIWKRRGEPVGDPQTALGHRQQHDAAVRRETTAVEIRCDFLAGYGWKRERQDRNVGHGERGWRDALEWIGVSNQILRRINVLCHVRQPRNAHLVNKSG